MLQLIRNTIVMQRLIFGVSFAAIVLLCGNAFAQQYKGWALSDKVAEEEAKKAQNISRSLASGNIDQATFDTYFKKYYFHRWTQPKNLSNLNTYVRKDFLDTDLKNATGKAKSDLLKLSIAVMKKMKSDPNVAPAVRYNAVVVLGLLYEDGNARTKLFAPALPVLLEEYNSPTAPDANKIAALNGIVRFAHQGIEDEKLRKDTIPKLFLDLALQTDTPEGRENEIHQLFFRANAIRGMGALCRAHSDELQQSTLDALLKLINDPKERDEIRYGAAMALSEINYTAASSQSGSGVKFDSTYIYETIGSFMLYVCEAEKKYNNTLRLTEQARSSSSGAGGMRGVGGSMMDSSSSYDSGGSSYSSSGSMGGGAAKDTNRLEQSMRRSKLAFRIAEEMIKGTVSDKTDENNFLGLLKKENTPESLKRIETLKKAVKIADEYNKFLKNGPPEARVAARPRQPSGTSGGGARPVAANQPKVTMMDIPIQLDIVSDELKVEFGPLVSVTPNARTNPETGQTPLEGEEVEFEI